MKKETLEEACKRVGKELDYSEFDYTSFKLGAKWQAKRMYSEEEVLELLKEFRHVSLDIYAVDWFEQFKKK